MHKTKHIAMYIGSLNKGGAERVMCNLARFFCNEGYKVTLVTTYLADDEYDVPEGKWQRLSEGDREDNNLSDKKVIKVLNPDDEERKVLVEGEDTPGIDRVFTALLQEERGGRLSNFHRRVKKLKDTWKRLKPDLILSFLGKNNVMAIYSSMGLNIPVVVSVRSNPSREYGPKGLNLAMKLMFPMAAGVVVQTTGARDYFNSRIQNKCVILPNSIHPDFYRVEPSAFEKRLRTIVSVGRLDDNKNQVLLLRAFAGIMDEFPEYSLVLYGDGPSRRTWEQEAEDILAHQPGGNGEKRIRFMGNVSGVADHIKDARIFVLTSRQEGMPNALIEAMALGLACISTDCPCGGPADLIKSGENGILIPMASKEEMKRSLEDALRKLMRDDELCRRISANAAYVRDSYSPDRINGMWKSYFGGIMTH